MELDRTNKDIFKRLKQIKLPNSYRAICISDIHGNLTSLKRLLKKINYSKEKDYLFMLGDLFDLGEEETAPTVDYLYELSKCEKVHIITGNHDRRVEHIQSENFQQMSDWLKSHPENILTQWAKTLGTEEITKENYKSVIAGIKQRHQDKINFILDLPLIIETDDFICVHSGLESREDWWETSEWNAFHGSINAVNKTGKWIISGHEPVILFHPAKFTFLPIIRNDNKTVSIDGGSGYFFDAQLNALIIEKSGENKEIAFSYDWADKCRQGIITENIKSDYKNEVTYCGGKNVEVLERGEYFSKCRVIDTGAAGLLKNEYFAGFNADIFGWWPPMADFVSVRENEIVSVLDDTSKGYVYIRNSKGELGWIPNESINIFKSERYNYKRLPLEMYNDFKPRNVRDIGGFPAGNGGITRWKTFLRAEGLEQVTERDAAFLYEYGVRTVIDLRTNIEFENNDTDYLFNVFKSNKVTLVNMPFIDNYDNIAGHFYIHMADNATQNIKRIFEYIGERLMYGGIIYNCFAGKDRTGVLSALLLLLCEVSELDILADYMVSSVYLRPLAEKLNLSDDFLSSKPEFIEEFLIYFKRKYISAEQYLLSIGVSQETLTVIKENFICQ